MNKTTAFNNLTLILATFLLLIASSYVPAQTLPPDQNSRVLPSSSPTPPPSSATPATDQDADTAQEETIYGLQGLLVETLEGKTVSVQSPDEAFNPASTIKLATALIALRTFGPEYRFTMGVWTTGTFDKTTGTVNGDLYLSGRDPSFHYEHAVMVARQLNLLGIRRVTGNLILAPGFTMNFNWSARRSGEQFYDTLDSSLRSPEATRAWLYERTALADKSNLQVVPSVAVMGEVQVGPVAAQAKLLLSHKSSRLVDILKVLLCYSNNFMAERLGDTLGGIQSVTRQITSSLNLGPEELRIATLSGLGVNRVSPRTMMKIYRALREELRKNKLSTTDILPVAGIDPGTLEDRFKELPWRGSVIAKTGTLTRTDGGASALVGQIKTASGETLLFVIMNRRGNVLRFRENQDFLVMQIQSTRGGPRPFDYKPHALTMKLADTQSSLTPGGDEYEPKLRSTTSP